MKKIARLAYVSLVLAATACERSTSDIAQGYIEADYVFVAAQVAGRIESVSVDNGATVNAGETLAVLDGVQARAQLDDARATLRNAEREYQRYTNLPRGKVVSESAVDLATRNYETAQSAVTAAQWALDQRTLTAPVDAVVDEVLFRPGEVVTTGQPVIRLLAPDSRKVRFYVNEAVLPRLALGTPVTVTCDGCGSGVSAKVSFIAPQAEYTPPVIYSLETREKLVFMIEAIPESPAPGLHVGLPVSVTLPPSGETAP